MIKSKVTFVVNQPLEQAFAYATDPERFSLWMPGLISVSDLSNNKLSEGSTFTIRHHENGKMEDLKTRVMVHVPGQKWSLLATGKKIWFRRTWEFRQRSNGTEITYTEERTNSTGGLSFMFFLMNNMYQVLSEEGCENLKKLMENAAHAPTAPSAS
jgi:uncharacterized protein YndB with AHSA1/START domain